MIRAHSLINFNSATIMLNTNGFKSQFFHIGNPSQSNQKGIRHKAHSAAVFVFYGYFSFFAKIAHSFNAVIKIEFYALGTQRLDQAGFLNCRDERRESSFNGDIDDYEVLDLNASYRILDGLEIYGRVENLTDESYVEVPTYNTSGAAGYAGVRA